MVKSKPIKIGLSPSPGEDKTVLDPFSLILQAFGIPDFRNPVGLVAGTDLGSSFAADATEAVLKTFDDLKTGAFLNDLPVVGDILDIKREIEQFSPTSLLGRGLNEIKADPLYQPEKSNMDGGLSELLKLLRDVGKNDK